MNAGRASLERVLALAGAGLRQAVRDKLLHVLLGFCGILIAGSVIVSQLTVGERARIVMNLGLSATSILANLVGAFVTINQAAREIERKTVVMILAKPVARWELVAGRFAGMGATLGFMVACMGALHAVVLALVGGYRVDLWPALALTWLEALVVVAIALFFSCIATPLPSMFLTLAFIVIGHSTWTLHALATRNPGPVGWLLEALYRGIPNLSLLNVRSAVTWGEIIPASHVAHGLLYAAGCCAVLLGLGSLALSRRDLT